MNKKDFVTGSDPISITPGEMLATLRRLQELSQNKLAQLTKMTQANISNMESGRQQIGRARALVLAKALKFIRQLSCIPITKLSTKRPKELQKKSFLILALKMRTKIDNYQINNIKNVLILMT